jgi:hypothetical protein
MHRAPCLRVIIGSDYLGNMSSARFHKGRGVIQVGLQVSFLDTYVFILKGFYDLHWTLYENISIAGQSDVI